MEKDMVLTYRGVDITSKTALCTCRQCLEPTLTEIDNMLAVPPPKPICHSECLQKAFDESLSDNPQAQTCPNCEGLGCAYRNGVVVDGEYCKLCGGSGKFHKAEIRHGRK